VHMPLAMALAGPALAGALVVFIAGRAFDHGDSVQPPWYTAWLLLPGAFLLAGAAAMCIFGALVEFALIASTMWFLLIAGSVTWGAALVLVRSGSR
ncbi:MAG: hypothetical protein ACREOM_14475, partial [Candidatus Dormibacteraceae bacterium]